MSTIRRAAALVVAAFLIVGAAGCSTPVDKTSGDAIDPRVAATPAAAPTSPARTAAPRSAAPTSSGSSEPSVPQYRATLPPATEEPPAPTRFTADSIDIRLPIIKTGVADTGQMQLPESNRQVAWYEFGSRPGDKAGTTVMAAHVDTRAEGLGPFARLRQLRPGQQISVADATGREHRYSVTAVEEIPKSRVVIDRLFRRDGPPELKVLTCGGPYSREAGYRDNVVVTALPLR